MCGAPCRERANGKVRFRWRFSDNNNHSGMDSRASRVAAFRRDALAFALGREFPECLQIDRGGLIDGAIRPDAICLDKVSYQSVPDFDLSPFSIQPLQFAGLPRL